MKNTGFPCGSQEKVPCVWTDVGGAKIARLTSSLVCVMAFSLSALAAWHPGLKQGVVSNKRTVASFYATEYRDYPTVITTNLTYSLCNTGSGMGNYQTAVAWGQFRSESKTYAFTGLFDDTVTLFIDGKLVMDSTPLGYCRQAYGTVTLAAGWHDFELRTGNVTGDVYGMLGGWALKYGIPAEDGEGVYERTLADDGNMTVFRYDDGVPTASTIPVYCGNGFESKFVDGPTSYTDDLVVGSVFSATASEISGDGWKDVPTGYIRREYDATAGKWTDLQIEGGTIEWTVTETPVAFVWLWERKYDIEMTAGANGSVESENGWITAGGRVQVSAVPNDGYAFLKWIGTVPHGLEFAPAFDEPLNAKFQAEAVFTDKVLYVSPGGDDANSGAADAPFATIAAAVAAASDNTVVFVQDGNYSHDTVLLNKSVVVRSLSGDRSKVTLSGGSPAFEIANTNAAIVSLTLLEPQAALVARAGVAYDIDMVSPTAGNEKSPIALGGASPDDVFVLRKSRVKGGRGTIANAVYGAAGGVNFAGTSYFVDDIFWECNNSTWHGTFSIEGGTGDIAIDRCVVRDNYGAETCFMNWSSSGTLKVSNSLFLGNKASNGSGYLFVASGGPIYLEGLTCRGNQCNFVQHYSGSGSLKGYVNRSIFWDGGTLDDAHVYNSCWAGATAGQNGNTSADPQFEKPYYSGQAAEAGDVAEDLWRFAETSPCADLETVRVMMGAFGSVSDDISGYFRPVSGAVNGLPLADTGCYEKLGPFNGNFRVSLETTSPSKALVGEPIVVSATLLGANRTLKKATWTVVAITGDVVATSVVETVDAPLLALSDPAAGIYSVTADFENSEGDIARAELSAVTFVRGVREIYVANENEDAAFPWNSPATAATDFQRAIDLLVYDDETPAKVHMLAGSYDLGRNGTGALPDGTRYSMILDGNIQVVSDAGPEMTSLSSGENVFYLNHPKAIVAGVKFDSSIVKPFRVRAGMVSNCLVRASSSYSSVAGKVVDCDFRDFTANSVGMLQLDGGGCLERCVIENIQGSMWGIVMTATDSADTSDRWIRGCTICNNKGAVRTLSLEMGHTFVEYCVMTNNTPAEAVLLGGGNGNVLANSLLANNGECSSGAVAYASPSPLWITNVTIVANGGIGVSGGANVCNSIIFENATDIASASSVAYSCFKEAQAFGGEGNIDDDPLFKGGNWPYRISPRSPCREAGINYLGVELISDLLGKPRLFGRCVDMGCYENQSGGLMIMVQ